MKTITVNRKTYKISQPVIDAIGTIERAIERGRPYALRGEFEWGSGRHRRNPIASLGRDLFDASAGALEIVYPFEMADKIVAAHPRAEMFVKPDVRRLRLVARKLRALGMVF